MDLATYRRLWHDEAIGGLGIYLAPRADVAQVIAQRCAPPRTAARRCSSAPTPSCARSR